MKKEFVLQLVENSASSIFSREDVIKLINSVEGGGRVISVDDIERAIELVTMAHSCLSGQHMQDSDGGRKHRTCVRMQWWCCGCGTKRFSCL
jgi:hypothetical protein